ncbi:UDP-glucose 4-epimerase [Cohnella sp. CIP 111063]|uniref:NAD-dependent epimerase/dehydratase family protein n=1 Tax=unclassified Cohnella TaxID=2636738 RepID=UPI000B8BB889|nr:MULTISPECIES: NAD-dependent epimerase/dehydratase family protein [unclassified Cohnella]OXS55917.1 UDP-glucose 4-epimerase [Cohnella sp. CIP 111063]PRX67121.1 UDP-glucose 4-epimerase [Cohnella sp. SGD-V74]
MNVLVIGGAGFIASNLVDALLQEGYNLAVIDNLSTGARRSLSSSVKFYNLNILDNTLERAFQEFRPQIVFHYAAQVDVQTSITNPSLDAEANIIGTLRVLQCCTDYGVRKLIYASTAAVYGTPKNLPLTEEHPNNPISFYGLSKLVPEKYIELFSEQYGLEYTILRFSNAYGIRQSSKGEGGVVSAFLSRLLRGENVVIYGDGNHSRDFIYVKDIVSANLQAITLGTNRVYNISCSRQTSINQLLETMCELTGRPFQPTYCPARTGDIVHSRMDNYKARHELGWEPKYSLEHGLEEMINYYFKNRSELQI